jgi:aminomethyltransferase
MRTPLFEEHKRLGAHFIEFAGWEMPVRYASIIEEHNAVRNSAGLFDVSHLGRINVSGSDAMNFIQRLITNDASQLAKKQALYTLMCYESGTIIDDLLVYKLDDDHFMLIINASNRKKDFEWMKKKKEENIQLKDVSNELAMIALQGPNSEKIFQKLTDYDLSELKYFWADEMKLGGIKVMTSRTGYTGEDGFEIYSFTDKIERVWNKILQLGKSEGAVPVGLGARDTLRLEACYLLYGNDIDETTTPLEAPLSWAVKFDKGYFIGKERLLEQKEKGVKKKLIGFEMIDRGIPRSGYKIFVDNDEIGHVTSGTFSPTLKKNIGLGYIEVEYKEIGKEIKIQIRNNFCLARIVKIPFYRRIDDELKKVHN